MPTITLTGHLPGFTGTITVQPYRDGYPDGPEVRSTIRDGIGSPLAAPPLASGAYYLIEALPTDRPQSVRYALLTGADPYTYDDVVDIDPSSLDPETPQPPAWTVDAVTSPGGLTIVKVAAVPPLEQQLPKHLYLVVPTI